MKILSRTGSILLLLAITGCRFSPEKPDGAGTIECTQVRVAPEIAGRIAEIFVQEGDVVKKDQLLARLDDTSYALRRAEAQAAATLAREDLRRIKEVFEKNSVSVKQKEEAQARSDQANAALGLAEYALTNCLIKAPMDGTITTRSMEPGEMVAPGSTLLTLSRMDEVWLSIYIPEPRMAQVKLGQPATVMVDGDKTRHQGTVTFISPIAEFAPRNIQTADERAKLVFRIKVTLKNPSGVFKVGMPADAWLETK